MSKLVPLALFVSLTVPALNANPQAFRGERVPNRILAIG